MIKALHHYQNIITIHHYFNYPRFNLFKGSEENFFGIDENIVIYLFEIIDY